MGAKTQGLADKSDRMPILKQNSADPSIAGISMYLERFGKVREGQYWSGHQRILYSTEGRLMMWSPNKQRSLLEKIGERASEDCEVPYEHVVVARESKETTELLQILQGGQFWMDSIFVGSVDTPWALTT